MGWIKTAGLSVVIFGMCFMAFFTMFDELETNYGSDYNSSNSALNNLRTKVTNKTNESMDLVLSHQTEVVDGSIASADAEDNLIVTGFRIVKEVFTYPFQIYSKISMIIGEAFQIDINETTWFYMGIEFILIFLIIIAILSVLFKVML